MKVTIGAHYREPEEITHYLRHHDNGEPYVAVDIGQDVTLYIRDTSMLADLGAVGVAAALELERAQRAAQEAAAETDAARGHELAQDEAESADEWERRQVG